MQSSLHRLLVVGREEGAMREVTRVLEGDGHIVTGTLSDVVALDLASSTDFDAVLVVSGVSLPDRLHITTHVRKRQPSIPVVYVEAPTSVLIQLRQAFKEKQSGESKTD